MVTPFIAVRLFAATVLLGGVALAGTAMAKPAANETAVAAVAPNTAAIPVAVAAPVAIPDGSAGCVRKVKVVYAGYGEADRAGCTGTAKSAAAK